MNRLTATSILTTIAALGSSALIGCANTNPDKGPVTANEVSGPNAAKGQGSCSAAGCGGAKPADQKAEGSCSAAGCGAKPTSAPDEKTDAKTDATKTDVKADAKTDAKPVEATPGKTDDKKKPVVKKGGGGAGAGACGVGTCAATAKTPAKK